MNLNLQTASIRDLRQLAAQLTEVLNTQTMSAMDIVRAKVDALIAGIDQAIVENYLIHVKIDSTTDGKLSVSYLQVAPKIEAKPANGAVIPNGQTQANGNGGNGGNGQFTGTAALLKYASMKNLNISAYLDGGKVKNGVNSFRVLKELNPAWKGIANDVILAQIQAL